jgi:hypothetical protein
MKELINKLAVIQMSNYVRPEIKEKSNKEWVENGEGNEMYTEIIDAYYGSPTNSAIIDSYSRMIFGLGLNVNQNFISKKELKRVCTDMALFGEASVEIKPDGKIVHVPKQKVLPSKAVDGVVKSYWYSFDWSDTRKYEPIEIPAFGFAKKKESSIYVFRDYQVGQFYFSNPSYISALPYCELESELANYYINHVKNGLSFGHIINVNDGIPESEEVKNKMDKQIQKQLTGSSNAGKFLISYNENKDKATTVEALEVSDAHQQYQFLTQEAQDKICVSHKVVSGAILGIKEATGFSSNAEQIETAFNETMLNVITPVQETLLDGLEEITGLQGLEIIPLRKSMTDEAQKGQTTLSLKKEPVDLVADALIDLGEVVDAEEWELIDEKAIEGEPTISETQLKLAKTFSSFPNAKSEEDNDIFKIRYEYAGNLNPQREFCQKMIKAGKVYRKEDIDLAGSKVVNKGFGPNGTDTYSIWKWKGGANCHHFFQRKIYLRKNNQSITIAEAKKLLKELEKETGVKQKFPETDKDATTKPIDTPTKGYLPK